MLFKELPLIEPLLKALDAEGYVHPTPIQEQAIPIVLHHRDLLGCAQTGTGKTAAFALPILQLLFEERTAGGNAQNGKRPIRTLILTPTRELAIQIGESFTAYGRHTGVRNLVIFGGVSQHAQTEALRRGTDVLVATPGRLLDLMNQGFISLRDIGIFVLDEADRMLDMGFIHDVKKVIAKLPAKRQTLFFSATMPPEIAGLADSILTDPAKVEVTPVSSTAEKVSQAVYFVDKKDKKHLLIHLLKDKNIASALIFTRTKHGANRVAGDLSKAGIRAEAIHGNKSQNARQAALGNFKNGRIRVLVATDIAARGIDIEELSHVVNFELPNIPETYVHRIGRTGRAGASGIALSFCEAEELPYLKDIQKLTGQLVPVVKDHPYAADLAAPALPEPRAKKEQPRNGNKQPAPRPPAPPRREDIIPLPERKPDQERPARPEQQNRRDGRDSRDSRNANNGRSTGRDNRQPQQRDNARPQHEQPARSEKPQQKERSEQKPRPKQQESELAALRRNRFASILEVATIEKQAFSRRDRQKPGFGPQKPADVQATGHGHATPASGDNGGKRKNRRRKGGNNR